MRGYPDCKRLDRGCTGSDPGWADVGGLRGLVMSASSHQMFLPGRHRGGTASGQGTRACLAGVADVESLAGPVGAGLPFGSGSSSSGAKKAACCGPCEALGPLLARLAVVPCCLRLVVGLDSVLVAAVLAWAGRALTGTAESPAVGCGVAGGGEAPVHCCVPDCGGLSPCLGWRLGGLRLWCDNP